MSEPPVLNEDGLLDIHTSLFYRQGIDYSSTPDVTRVTAVFPDGSKLHTVTNDHVGMLPGTLGDKLLSTPGILAEWSKFIGTDKLKEIMSKTLSLCELIETTENNFSRFSLRVNYGRVPSKRSGRKGTRRDWKRAHSPKTINFEWTLALPPVTQESVIQQ